MANNFPDWEYIQGLKHNNVLCEFNIYGWARFNKDSKTKFYKCKYKHEGKECSASLTIDENDEMIRYKANHLHDHAPMTNEFKAMIEKHLAELRKQAEEDKFTPLEKLYDNMMEKLVTLQVAKLSLDHTPEQVDQIRQNLVDHVPSFDSLDAGRCLYFSLT